VNENMALLKDADRKRLAGLFDKEMERKVRIVNFTQSLNCQYCGETTSLLEELVSLSDKIDLDVFNFITDTEKKKKYKIDKIPATLLLNEKGKDVGIRFFGLPVQYEFSTLVEAILDVSKGRTGLNEDIRKRVKEIESPLHIEVFVTPTCPYCPKMVRIAHQFSLENENIRSDMIEVLEFPELSARYNVMGVPKTVINGKFFLEGAVPAEYFIEKIEEALEKSS